MGDCHYVSGNHRTAKRIPFLRNLLGYITLNGEDVFHFSIIAFRPEVTVTDGLDELSRYPEPIIRPSHTAFQKSCHSQLFSDSFEILLLILVAHDRGARDHRQAADLG